MSVKDEGKHVYFGKNKDDKNHISDAPRTKQLD